MNGYKHRWGVSYDGDIVECIYCGVMAGGKWSNDPCDGHPEGAADRITAARERKAAQVREDEPERDAMADDYEGGEVERFTGLVSIQSLAERMLRDIEAIQQTLIDYREGKFHKQ